MSLNTAKRCIRIREVVAKTGLSAATVWRLSAAGSFPRPIKMSAGCSAWMVQEIDSWIEAKAAARGHVGDLG